MELNFQGISKFDVIDRLEKMVRENFDKNPI